jgi:hypothetical protein
MSDEKKPKPLTHAIGSTVTDNPNSPTAGRLIGGALAVLVLACPAYASAQQAASISKTAEASFMAENQVAMSKMMKDMAVKPSGNIDADFTAMMIPHHQGAVEMAEAELQYGHNTKLRQIARNIIAGQTQQIGALKAALRQPLGESGDASQGDARPGRNAAR